ncbi:hypothetical protein NBRC10512_006579 [Rhodotorula toruloides]|uniref:RHTO0S10e05490g1_1 n=2 Tax=Rhodotorula toruloides TaxID=5286 RepID=A0A061B5Q7_RHOTO|nr:uncharacterized protein RHTO_08111 [Rhodotorula toruloides NP11]EMS22758.1 hypothetical protein RHTO_08111 [Rhodotorula toruloides NP11]KAJ8293071.1 hypothetical protein OF846_003779 [Rhodotorula toruloides]CDR45145.1 RHTO0S10e05490g1_1 [Rhodotorula toruloides]
MPSSVDAPTSSFDPLPSPYFLFFSILEPLLTFAGAAYAIFTPLPYYIALYPPSLLAPPTAKSTHVAATMIVRQLGSCFFLFAMMGCVLLPAMRRTLKDRPEELELLVRAYLTCLAAADLTHIGFTLFDLGVEGSLAPSGWNALVWGNVGITSVLFLVRMLWMAGVSRGSTRRAGAVRKGE